MEYWEYYYMTPIVAHGISSMTGLVFFCHTAYYTPNSRHYLILATHLWTFVSQLVSFFAIYSYLYSSSFNDLVGDDTIGWRLHNLSDFLILLQFLLIALLNVYILQIFSVLDSRITEKRIQILRAFLVLSFIVSCGLQLVLYFNSVLLRETLGFLSLATNLNFFFPIILMLYETVQSVYLVNLIYQLRKKTLERKDLNAAVILIVAIRILDFAGVLMLVVPSVDLPDLIQTSQSIVGIHSSALAYLFSLLKNLALTRKQKNAHKKLPKIVQAPAQIQQNEPAVQKDLATQKEGLQSKQTEIIMPKEQLESKKTEIIARP